MLLTVEEVRKRALKNYNKGGHFIVECWTDKDILEWLEQEPGGRQVKDLNALFKRLNGHDKEIRGSKF